jgi:hypothetical protein
MRRIRLILGLVVITCLIMHDIYGFFITNEGIHYFSSEPRRLLYVVLLAAGGGMVVFGISRLSPAAQRSLKLLALGGFGCLLVAAVAFFGHVLYSVAATPLIEAQLRGWIATPFCSMAVAAVLVWWELRQVTGGKHDEDSRPRWSLGLMKPLRYFLFASSVPVLVALYGGWSEPKYILSNLAFYVAPQASWWLFSLIWWGFWGPPRNRGLFFGGIVLADWLLVRVALSTGDGLQWLAYLLYAPAAVVVGGLTGGLAARLWSKLQKSRGRP